MEFLNFLFFLNAKFKKSSIRKNAVPRRRLNSHLCQIVSSSAHTFPLRTFPTKREEAIGTLGPPIVIVRLPEEALPTCGVGTRHAFVVNRNKAFSGFSLVFTVGGLAH